MSYLDDNFAAMIAINGFRIFQQGDCETWSVSVRPRVALTDHADAAPEGFLSGIIHNMTQDWVEPTVGYLAITGPPMSSPA